VGIVTLRELLLAQSDAVLRDFMRREFFYAAPEDSDQAVARKLAEYNLMALPVLDPNGRVLGIITVDDALDVLLPTGWQRRLPRIFS
jgi:Mg/Co/Ni transporter MgtE